MKTPRAPVGKPALVVSALLPHAPILVPGVGPDRGDRADRTAAAMSEAARRIIASGPEALVLLSPHAPWRGGAFGIYQGRNRGSLAEFGAPEAAVSLAPNPKMERAIERDARARGVDTWQIKERPLDHGSVVPLTFLAGAGWDGPTTVIGLAPAPQETLESLGLSIAAAAQAAGRATALIASGDMSHRLNPSSPCGHHPRAHEFDEAFIRHLGASEDGALRAIDPELRGLAGEDALDPTLVAIAACGSARGREVLSYDAPFGVGYGVAILFCGV